MTTTPLSNNPTGTQLAPKGATPNNFNLNPQDFIKMMITQLQNQDPLQPTDSAQMLSQLAQFANVEGINKLNKQTTALGLGQDFAGSVAMIGKTVTWLDDKGAIHSGVVNAVKPSPSGALLVIGNEDIPSGNVQKVE